MKEFKIESSTPDQFSEKITRIMRGGELGKIASIKRINNEMIISFSKFGTSTMVYTLEEIGNGFKASLKKEKIAITHSLLKSEIESKLSVLMQRLGAIIIS